MYRRLALIFAFALMSAASPGRAHSGHSHKPVSETEAKERAVSAVIELVKLGKVDEKWKGRTPTLAKKKFGGQTEWVATFERPEAKDPTKRRLYVFLALDGEYLAANYTGN